MKKILSFLLLAAMLVGCLTPAFSTMAAGAPALAISDTTYTEQSMPVAVTADVTIADNNVAIVELSLVVYYRNDAINDVTVDLGDSIFTSADNTVGTVVAGTNRNVKTVLADAGIEDLENYSAVIVELYDDNDGVDVDGILAKATFALSSDLAVGDTAVYGVALKGAVDADDNDVDFDATADEGIATVVEDPYIGTHDDFTMFLVGPETVTVNDTTVTLEWRMDGNTTGLYSCRVFFFYPDGWEVESILSSGLFYQDVENPINGDFIPDFNKDAELYANDQGAVYAVENFNVDVAGKTYSFVMVQPDSPMITENRYSNGVIGTITFKVPEGVQAGDVLDVEMAYGEGEIFYLVEGPDGTPVSSDIIAAVENYSVTVQDKICDHASTHEETVDAECAVDGSINVVCDDCGKIISSTPIPATGHTAGEPVVVDAECEADGSTTVKCTVCGEVISTEVIPATGHTPGDAVVEKAATCAEEGKEVVRCTVCDKIISETAIEKLPHTAGETVIVSNATCTENGTTATECSVCHQIIAGTESVVEALDHDWVAGTTVEPTCTEEGYTNYSCSRCNETKIDDVVAAKGHTEVEEITPAQCTVDGLKVVKCSECGTVISETVLPMTGHSCGAVPPIYNPIPDCLEDRYVYATCVNCREEFVFVTIEAYGEHIDEVTETVEPTYYADGYVRVYCEHCGREISNEILPRLTVSVLVYCTVEVEFEGELMELPIYFDVVEGYVDDVITITAADIQRGIDEQWPGFTVVDFADIVVTLDEENDDIVVNATCNTDITYTVKYVDTDGNEIADVKVVTDQTMLSDAVEVAPEIDGYTLVGLIVDGDDITEYLTEEEIRNFEFAVYSTDFVLEFVYAKNAEEPEPEPTPVVPGSKPDVPNNSEAVTGDNMIFVVIALAVVAIASVAVIVIRRRKYED